MNKKNVLIVVESPAKAKKIATLLKNENHNYIVIASYGHICNLKGKNQGVDIKNNFKPIYEITNRKNLNNLKDVAKKCNDIIIASDGDREGEAIGWHILNQLKLPVDKTKRIIFYEITKSAIIKAINEPLNLNLDLVNAQRSRQIIDYIVGFNLSPLLWTNIKPKLSAGRVQSSTLRLVIDRENDIEKFNKEMYYKINGNFYKTNQNQSMNAVLNTSLKNKEECELFLNTCKKSIFKIINIKKNNSTRKPSPPLTTSSLLQECSNKLKLTSKNVMYIAQKLYESGKITYHRTDSTSLSKEIVNDIKELILKKYGQKFLKIRSYKTNIKCAQEAHEAIRPVNINIENIPDTFTSTEKNVYSLIWKRTIASQMEEAIFKNLKIDINIDNRKELFLSNAQKCSFKGFLTVYNYEDESEINSELSSYELLIKMKIGDNLKYSIINAEEKYTQNNGRYNDATLIKKMKDIGIGRPSTYSSMITTLIDREYITRETRNGNDININVFTLKNNKLTQTTKKKNIGKEVQKLFPTDIGKITCNFLCKHFGDILDYNYTSKLENLLDEIANGSCDYKEMIKKFYNEFNPKIQKVKSIDSSKKEKNSYIKELGFNNKNEKIIAKIGPYGPYVQCGLNETLKYASINQPLSIETITLNEAILLLQYPKNFGKYQGKNIIIKKGKYGPYIDWNSKTYSIINKNPDECDKAKAIEIITTCNQPGYIKKNNNYMNKNKKYVKNI